MLVLAVVACLSQFAAYLLGGGGGCGVCGKPQQHSSTSREPLLASPRRRFSSAGAKGMLGHVRRDWRALAAPVAMAAVLAWSAWTNAWPVSYPRQDNASPDMYGTCVVLMLVAAWATWVPTPRHTTACNRAQTDEWKGWMQLLFVLYHYYRATYTYNEVRVFVSSFVWMTGFGNYHYFATKRDFSWRRALAMVIRINYLPLLLILTHGTSIMLYYVVPLHTAYFFLAYATCYATFRTRLPAVCLAASLVALALLFEVPAVRRTVFFTHEAEFRFGLDRYSAWWGMLCAALQIRFSARAHACLAAVPVLVQTSVFAGAGAGLLAFWYGAFGHEADKYTYNPRHPYVTILPIVGYLCLRNCHPALRGRASAFLRWFGGITLEMYVLQFHVFMCRNVQHVLVLVPGGAKTFRALNTAVVGCAYVALAVVARKATIAVMKYHAGNNAATGRRGQAGEPHHASSARPPGAAGYLPVGNKGSGNGKSNGFQHHSLNGKRTG